MIDSGTTKLLLVGALAASLVACGGEETSNNNNKTDEPVVTFPDQGSPEPDPDMKMDEPDMKMEEPEPDMKMPEPDMKMEEPAYVFEGEEVACATNPGFEEAKAVLGGGKVNPTGRGEQGAVYDPCHRRVVLFGGNDNQPAQCNSFGPKNYVGDTWAYSLEHENWYRIQTANAPSDRGRHTFALDLSRKKMLIFGGRHRPTEQAMGNYTLFNDLWSFDINTDEWTAVGQKGMIPSVRFNSAMAYDTKGDRMVLFGGNSSPSGLTLTPLDDTYVLDLKTDTWTRVDSTAKPPGTIYHAMTYDSVNDQMIIFGGGDANAFLGPFYSDVWALDMQTLQWTKLYHSVGGNAEPLGRINPALIFDESRERVLLFGGHDDSALGNTNDIWAFTPSTRSWELLKAGDVYTGAGCNSFCSCADNFVQYDYESPERRQYPTFVPVDGEDTAVLFSGTGDCGYMDDTWSLDLDTMEWTEVHAAEQGIACARTGREDCVELCY